ncbi:hypothetical protein N656DRAFT_777064 [Canariomyces notabilis]|uniref:Secreted protein n=1 Tax=Canariomyces notabilis TaxID=2074819 RepID=A0AAN6YV39_9PEZI|nr:hypothetical protein N656DRAFT_777064 [Canariomyces arenarius]
MARMNSVGCAMHILLAVGCGWWWQSSQLSGSGVPRTKQTGSGFAVFTTGKLYEYPYAADYLCWSQSSITN